MKKFLLFPAFCLLLASTEISAQCTQQVLWANPSFEGSAQPHVLPAPWSNCNGTTTDTQPGNWGISAPATNGSTYAGLVSVPGWEETASQAFSPCLNPGQNFNFTVDLIKLNETSDGGGDCDGWLELWGGNSSGSACDQDVLLWSGPMMTTGGTFQNNWQTVNISFTPLQTICQLTFIAKNSTCYGSGDFYMGMDNLSSITPNITSTPTVVNNVSCGGGNNGSASIVASGGTAPYTYSWSNGASGSVQNNLAAGTYTINITDANGCPEVNTITITQPVPVSASLSPSSANCNQPNGSITTTPSGGTAGYSYSWSPAGGNAQNPTGLTPGGYTVTITDGLGCSGSASTTVGNTGSVSSPFATNNNSQCLSGNSFSFTNTGSSGGTVTQSWDFGDGTGTASSVNASHSYSSAGTYTITHVVTDGGCNSTTTTTVSVIQNPDANAGTSSVLTCSNTSVVLDGSTTTGGASLVWNGPGLSNAADPATASAAGTYTLTSNNGGCIATATLFVSANTAAPNAAISSSNTNLDCANPSATLTGSSSTGGASLSWSGPSGAIAGNPITVNSAGTYTLTATDPSNGCTTTQTQAITSAGGPPNISLNASNTTLNCAVTDITLTGSSSTSGATFAWSGPAGAISGNPISVNTAGTYTLTVTDPSNGCSSTQTQSIGSNTAIPAIALAASDDTVSCYVPSITLTGSSSTGGASLSWNGPSGSLAGNPVAVSSAGVYTLTVTDPSNGCSITQTQTIADISGNPNISSVASDDSLTCSVSTITLTGSSSSQGVSLAWSGPSGSLPGNPVTVASAGTYTLTVTDPTNGCTSAQTQSIAAATGVPNISLASSDDTLTCTVTSITLTGSTSTSGATLSWDGPAGPVAGNPISATSPGTFTLTVTDAGTNCAVTQTYSIGQNTNPPTAVASASQPAITCTILSSDLTGSSGSANATYSWSGPSGALSGNPVTVSSDGTYTLSVTDNNTGCTNSQTVVVGLDTVSPPVSINPAAPVLTCTTTSIVLTGIASNVSYNWSGVGTAPTFTATTSGVYTLVVTSLSNGCTNTANVTATTNTTTPDVSPGTGGTITCTDAFADISATSLTTGVTWNWAGPSGFTSSNQNDSTSVAGTYTVTVTDPVNGCTNTALVTIGTNSVAPVAVATAAGVLTCTNSSASLSGNSTTPGCSYNWAGPGGFTSNSQSPVVNVTGTYTLTVTDPSNNCTGTATTSVISNTLVPNVNAGINDTLDCSTAAFASLNGSSTNLGVTYNWFGPGGLNVSNTATASVSAAGQYTLVVTDPANGCSDSATVDIVPMVVVANFTATPVSGFAPLNVSFTNQSTGASSYLWSFGDGTTSTATDPTNTFTGTATYTVILTAMNGNCFDTASVVISIDATSSIVIPNVFTPNADGVNDVFAIKSVGIAELHADIFNRWGEKLYEMIGPNDAWDGKSRTGTDASSGTYFVILKAKGYDGKEYAMEAYVGLFR
jgi:gliding motility-associated-like protein